MTESRSDPAAGSAPPVSAPVGATASKALGWSLLNTAISRIGTLGIGIVLARVLGPSAFGTFAVATVALIAVLSFNELGVSLAIVRWPGDPRHIAPTVTTISVVSSCVLAAAAFFAAPSFAAAMGDPGATGVVRVMLVSIVVNGVVATPAALLQRDFRQGRKLAIDQVNVWLGAGLSVALALAGMGAMSLAIGRVAGSVVSGAMFLWLSPERYRFGFDRSQFPALLRFGLPLAGTSIIVFVIGYADQLTAGGVLGPRALGFYVLAFNLASWPVSVFSQPLRSVAPAAFSRLQHDPAGMVAALRSTIGLLGAVTIPVCLMIAAGARPIVELIYGQQWFASAPVLTWLALLAAFRIFFELAYDFLVVLGRSSVILLVQSVWLVALVPALVIGAHLWDLRGLAASQVVIAAAVITPLYLHQFRAAGLLPRQVAGRLWAALSAGAAVGLGTAVVSRAVPSALVACVLAGLLCMAAIAGLVYRDRAQLRSLRSIGAAG